MAFIKDKEIGARLEAQARIKKSLSVFAQGTYSNKVKEAVAGLRWNF